MKVEAATGKIVFGVACAWLMVALATYILLQPGFDAQPRVEIMGEVAEVETPITWRREALDITLAGEATRLRIFDNMFQGVLRGRIPAGLVPGAKVRATADKATRERPPTLPPYNAPTITIDALEVDGTTVLSLDDARDFYGSNRKGWFVLGIVCCAMSVYLSLMLRRRLREERSSAY